MVNSLYSDASVVGRRPALRRAVATNFSPSTRATSASVCRWARLLAHDGVVLQRLAVAGGALHVVGEQLEALEDGRQVNSVNRSRSSASEMYWNPRLSSPTT